MKILHLSEAVHQAVSMPPHTYVILSQEGIHKDTLTDERSMILNLDDQLKSLMQSRFRKTTLVMVCFQNEPETVHAIYVNTRTDMAYLANRMTFDRQACKDLLTQTQMSDYMSTVSLVCDALFTLALEAVNWTHSNMIESLDRSPVSLGPTNRGRLVMDRFPDYWLTLDESSFPSEVDLSPDQLHTQSEKIQQVISLRERTLELCVELMAASGMRLIADESSLRDKMLSNPPYTHIMLGRSLVCLSSDPSSSFSHSLLIYHLRENLRMHHVNVRILKELQTSRPREVRNRYSSQDFPFTDKHTWQEEVFKLMPEYNNALASLPSEEITLSSSHFRTRVTSGFLEKLLHGVMMSYQTYPFVANHWDVLGNLKQILNCVYLQNNQIGIFLTYLDMIDAYQDAVYSPFRVRTAESFSTTVLMGHLVKALQSINLAEVSSVLFSSQKTLQEACVTGDLSRLLARFGASQEPEKAWQEMGNYLKTLILIDELMIECRQNSLLESLRVCAMVSSLESNWRQTVWDKLVDSAQDPHVRRFCRQMSLMGAFEISFADFQRLVSQELIYLGDSDRRFDLFEVMAERLSSGNFPSADFDGNMLGLRYGLRSEQQPTEPSAGGSLPLSEPPQAGDEPVFAQDLTHLFDELEEEEAEDGEDFLN